MWLSRALIEEARRLTPGVDDVALIDQALGLLLARERARVDDAYARAFRDHPLDQPDE